jgi:hypothetical protein
MEKNSYELNKHRVHPDDDIDGVVAIGNGFESNGTAHGSSSGYISDRKICSLYS